METYKSSVFRQGDWNVAEPRSVQHSVTCNDFHIKPISSKTDGFKDTKQQGEEKQPESEEYPVNPKGIDYANDIWKIKYLNGGEEYDDMIYHHSYTHSLSSCEIKAWKNKFSR